MDKTLEILKQLQKVKTNRTNLISYYVSANSPLWLVNETITNEISVSANIKDKTVRKNVLSALKAMRNRTSKLKVVPKNGMAIFASDIDSYV